MVKVNDQGLPDYGEEGPTGPTVTLRVCDWDEICRESAYYLEQTQKLWALEERLENAFITIFGSESFYAKQADL